MATVLIVLFGILLPFVTLAIELRTGMCAGTLGDPIPTIGHVLLVAFVPLANLAALVGGLRGWTQWRSPLLWSNGARPGDRGGLHPGVPAARSRGDHRHLRHGDGASAAVAFVFAAGRDPPADEAARDGGTRRRPVWRRAGAGPRSSLVSLLGGEALGIARARLAGSENRGHAGDGGNGRLGLARTGGAGARPLAAIRQPRRPPADVLRGRSRPRPPLPRSRSLPLHRVCVPRPAPRRGEEKVFFRVTGQPYDALPPAASGPCSGG